MVSDVHTRDGLGLELDDVAPSPGRGLVMEVFREDTTGEWTVASFVKDPLPLELIERFLAEARRNLAITTD
jgi:hypothetical protein